MRLTLHRLFDRILPIFLTIIIISVNVQPHTALSGDMLTSTSYESFILDQIDGKRAWEFVNILANSTFAGRLAATPGQYLAASFIASLYAELGLLPAGDLLEHGGTQRSYSQTFTLSNEQGKWSNGSTENVLGWLKGQSNELVIISAHYDHLGNWLSDEESPFSPGKGLYAGADDNASGVAVLLELARVLKEFTTLYGRPYRSILFACWSAEEAGLHGSRYYYQNPTIFSIANTVLNINFDMVGGIRTENYGFEIEGGTEFPEIFEKFEMASAISGVPVHNTSIGRLSDHYTAYIARIPAVLMFWDSMNNVRRSHPYYHTPQDTPDQTDPINLRDAGVLTCLVLQTYCFDDLIDTTAPAILDITPPVLDVGEVTFFSRVVDNKAVKAVILHYSTDGGTSWSLQPMMRSSTTYTTSIEIVQMNFWILFFISAIDDANNTAKAAISEFPVDTIPPVIHNVRHVPSSPNAMDEIMVKAQVEDNLRIDSVMLQYSINGSDKWESASMQLVEGYYIVDIGPFSAKTNITYYIRVIDVGGNTAEMETQEFSHFTIQEAPLLEFNGALISFILACGLLFPFMWQWINNRKKR